MKRVSSPIKNNATDAGADSTAKKSRHNARGPGKDGMHFHPDVTLCEVMALAARMSIKNAAALVVAPSKPDQLNISEWPPG